MKYPKAKFKVKDHVIIDDFDTGYIDKAGLFRKHGKIAWSYRLAGNILPGFWVEQGRLKLIKPFGKDKTR